MLPTLRDYKKWLSLLSLLVMIGLLIPSGLLGTAVAVAGQVDANNVSTAPTIDGNLSESGWNLAQTVNKTTIGTPNNTVTMGAMWNSTYLFVGVRVLDGNLFNDSANTWEDDSVEIYIDANNNKGTTYDSFDRQYVKGYNDSTLGGIGSQTGVVHAWAAISGGYSVELAIPWSNLGVTGAAGLTMGFDVGYNDDDNAGTRDSQAVWWGNINNYQNTSAFGSVVLQPAGGTMTPTNTPPSGGQGAYPSGNPWAIPGTIQAEDFDTGGENVAYHDLETANQGGQYRTADGVDIETTGDTGGGFNVGWTRTNEWIEYTVNVSTAGNYTLLERVASGATTGQFRVEFNGVDKTGVVTVPNTGGFQTYQNLSQTVNLSAGVQVMRIFFTGNDANLNYFNLTTAGATNTPTNTPVATNTPTNTQPGPSNTPTNTQVATNTPTNTSVVTNTPTNTPVPGATYVRFKSKLNNNYLYESANKVVYGNPVSTDQTSQWTIETFGANKRIHNRSTGNFMNIENLLGYVQCTVVQDTWMSSQWTVENAPTASYFVFRNVWQNSNIIHIQNLNGNAQYGNIPTSDNSAQWYFEFVDSGGTIIPTATPTKTNTPGPTNTPLPPGWRGASMPYTRIEAESASTTKNGTTLAQNFNLSDYAGEASGRSAVFLDATGEYVQFTLPSAANAIVVRHAIPNSADGVGIDSTISLYIGGVDKGTLPVSSKYSYVYTTPSNLAQLGYNNTPGQTPYWLYEESNMMLDATYPAGTTIKLQKDSGDVQWIYVDFAEFENVAPAASNPNPAQYVQVSSTKTIDQALNEFRADTSKLGIFIPAGTWALDNKIFVYGRPTQIIGAGPWHTRLVASQSASNTDMGFNIASTANGSTIKNLSAWGNYHYRVDGPGKFIDGNGMQNVTLDNLWVEHFICLYWGVNSSNNTFKNLRIRNTFADGINMTNSSSNNLITNSEARGTGDDAFAEFSAIDAGGSYNVGNQYTYLTAILTRRAAAFAAYGGHGNVFQNLYAADSLTYPGITISSLSFGLNTLGFGTTDTVFDGITLERVGGDFWSSAGGDDVINQYQNFAAIWFFAGDKPFQNILVKNIDISNPVYFGLMFQTKYPEQPPMTNVRIQNVNINNAPRYGIKLVVRAEGSSNTPPIGSASFTNVLVNNAGIAKIYGEAASPGFTVNRVSGNNW